MILRRAAIAVVAVGLLGLGLVSAVGNVAAAAQPVGLAAPYEYLGWGSPPSPTKVMAATGITDFTMAFVLSKGSCTPTWDGTRPLTGGVDQSTIAAIRAAGGDVSVSFGGWSGTKLGSSCRTSAALAAAYQQVIDAYSLHAIDVDIEHTEFSSAAVRTRIVTALATVQSANPGIEISVTFPTTETGPDATGRSLIDDAAAIDFQPSSWTIMPFDFGAPVADMGAVSVAATRGLEADVAAAYHESATVAFAHSGISTMNGRTDETDETVSTADLRTMLTFAQTEHLARLTFWAVDRDRPCAGTTPSGGACSGIAQAPFAFTSILAGFHG